MLEKFNIHKEIQEVYIHRFLFVLALSAITVFLPIYVYDITNSLVYTMLFFLIYNGIRIITSLPIAKITSKIGYKRTALLSSPFTLLFYNLMRNIHGVSFQLFFIAIVGGIGLNLYWVAMNSEISNSSHKEKRDHEMGVIYAIPIIATIISPFIGGIISNNYGFNTLFLAVILVISVSFIPFLFSFEHFDGMNYSIKKYFSREYLKDFITYSIQGVNFTGFFELWPLYFGLIITGTLNLGAMGSLRALGGALASLFLGKFLKKQNRIKALKAGVAGFAVTWILMSMITTPLIGFFVSFLNEMMMRTTEIPIFSGIIGIAENDDRLEYFAFREMAIATGRTFILLFMTFMFYFFGKTTSFTVGFIFIALLTLLLVPLARKMNIGEL